MNYGTRLRSPGSASVTVSSVADGRLSSVLGYHRSEDRPLPLLSLVQPLADGNTYFSVAMERLCATERQKIQQWVDDRRSLMSGLKFLGLLSPGISSLGAFTLQAQLPSHRSSSLSSLSLLPPGCVHSWCTGLPACPSHC